MGLWWAVEAVIRPSSFRRRAVGVLACAVFAAGIPVHANAARSFAERETAARATEHAAGEMMRRVAAGRPCRFVAQYGYPQIELASGCEGTQARFDQPVTLPRRFRYAQPGSLRFAVGPSPPAAGSPVTRWRRVPIGDPPTQLYVAPEAGLP
jgi:hypothetical protein